MLVTARSRQTGLTIIELLVGMAVGILVVGGGITMYVSSIRASSETLKSSKLNQEVAALMSVITNDVRRAGYWQLATNGNYEDNPFSQAGATLLEVRDDMSSNTNQGALGQGSCLTYTYDATYLPGNTVGSIDSTDLFGFRLNGTVVQMRQTGVVDGAACVGGTCTSCTNGTWQNVTDPNLIEVTNLNFDLSNSLCLNSSEPNGADDNGDGTDDDLDEYDCYSTVPPVNSGEATAETRQIIVSITARLADDTDTQITSTQSVRVRNDHLTIH